MKMKFTAIQLSLVIMFCVSLIAIAISRDDSKTYLIWINVIIGVIWLLNVFINAMQDADTVSSQPNGFPPVAAPSPGQSSDKVE
jgi:hypothetical protein